MSITAVCTLSAQEVSIYGFLDVEATRFVIDDDSPLWLESMDNSLRFRQSKLNKYFDYSPNDNMRVLTELGLHWQPHGFSTSGRRIVVDGNAIDTVAEPHLYENQVDLMLSGSGEEPVINLTLQRAWMEYNLSQYSNFRIGKFITPVGIWNVDHGSPVIITGVQPYSTGIVEVFPTSQTGVMYYGRTYLDMYDLDYKIYISSGRDVQAIDDIRDVSVGGNVKFRSMDWGDGFEFGVSGYTGIDRAEEQWADIQGDFLIGPDGNPVIGDDGTPVFIPDGSVNAYTEMKKQAREHAVGADVKFEFKNILLQSEFNFNLLKNQLNNDEESRIFGTYLLGGYNFRINDNLSIMPYSLVEMIRADNLFEYDENPMANAVVYSGRTVNDFYDHGIFSGGFADQLQSVIFGVNTSVFGRSNIKLQYAHLDFSREVNSESDNDKMNLGIFNLQFTVAY
jgi:hypothetical protein